MNQKISELVDTIRALEEEIEAEIASRRAQLRFTLEGHKVRFEASVLAQHQALKTGILRYLSQARFRNLVSAPFIYAMVLPLLILDLTISLYQWICFPLYQIPRVRRRDYFVFDRHDLAYLNAIEKFNCTYCSYANGLAAYSRAIIGMTEQYWCPIKHARRLREAHTRYDRFTDFGDAEAYRTEGEHIRQDLRNPDIS